MAAGSITASHRAAGRGLRINSPAFGREASEDTPLTRTVSAGTAATCLHTPTRQASHNRCCDSHLFHCDACVEQRRFARMRRPFSNKERHLSQVSARSFCCSASVLDRATLPRLWASPCREWMPVPCGAWMRREFTHVLQGVVSAASPLTSCCNPWPCCCAHETCVDVL
jgi:hypothetical protein